MTAAPLSLRTPSPTALILTVALALALVLALALALALVLAVGVWVLPVLCGSRPSYHTAGEPSVLVRCGDMGVAGSEGGWAVCVD